MEKICGIYEIRNNVNGKVYVGQSRDIAIRKSNHKSKLIKGKHHNKYLQREFNKYGLECFSFNVLELCSVEMLNDLEVRWITKFNSMNNKNGFNLEGGGNADKIVSERLRAAKRGANNPAYGKAMSEEQKEMIRIANRASSDLLTESDVADIKRRLCRCEDQQNISKEYGVHFSTVSKIATCKNWEWVLPELNEKIISVKKSLKESKRLKIKELWESGETAADIAKATGSTSSTVKKVVGTSRLQELKGRALLIADDYKSGLTRDQLQEKYNVKRSVVNRAVRDLYQEELQKMYGEWIEMRRDGISVGDIAKKYNVHRTTVTENTKDYWENTPSTVKVVRLGNDGELNSVYDSIKDAERKTGALHSNITSACRGRIKTSGGFRWMYYDDYIKQQPQQPQQISISS